MYRALMVCMGNICRSPIAEAVLQERFDRAGLKAIASSAGTGDWHVGEPADRRATAALQAGGYTLRHSARQFRVEWFDTHDLVVAMDRQNQRDLHDLRPDATVHLLREWDPVGPGDVPDPYYGDRADFESVVTMVERSCDALVQWMLSTGQLP